MNNQNAKSLLDSCTNEINSIKQQINLLGATNNAIPFLVKYVIIRACGTIEQSVKTIIADYCEKGATLQIKNYISLTIRENSSNPNLYNINKMLTKFDKSWAKKLERDLKATKIKIKLEKSLQSLVDARNMFAHGGNPSITFKNVMDYYIDSESVIRIIDSIIK